MNKRILLALALPATFLAANATLNAQGFRPSGGASMPARPVYSRPGYRPAAPAHHRPPAAPAHRPAVRPGHPPRPSPRPTNPLPAKPWRPANHRPPVRPGNKVPGLVRPPKHVPGRPAIRTARYAPTYGVRLRSGYYAYKGIGHHHWSRRHFCHRWRCWTWYCPSTGLWYYWAGHRGLYLPVRYLPAVAPTVVEESSVAELPPEADDVPVATEEEIPDVPEP